MFKKINQCDVYVGMWCIYMLQEVLYSPGIINQLLQLIMLFWALIALFKHLLQSTEHSSILNATLLLITMYVIYGSIHMMMMSKHYYLQISLNSLAPIFLFYSYAKDGKLTSDRIRIYLPFLVITCILLFYRLENASLSGTGREETTNNSGYMFITLIPLLFFYFKKPFQQYLYMGIIFLFLFMGMKRGAILIGTIVSILFLHANIKNSSRWMKFLVILLSIIIVAGINRYIDYMINNSSYFMARVEQTMEGDSSGRDAIYTGIWNTLLSEQSPLKFYLGRGAESTLTIVGKFAHQDWLETFCNNGLLGVLILLYFFYTFGKNVWKSRLYFSGMMFYSFVTLFIIIFSKTFFSMSIQDLTLPESMLLGFFAYWASQPTDNFEIYNYEQDE